MKSSNFVYIVIVLCGLMMSNSAWPHDGGGGGRGGGSSGGRGGSGLGGGHYGGGFGGHHGGGFVGHHGGGFALGYGLGYGLRYGPFGGYGLYNPYWGYGGYYGYGYAYPPVITVPSTPPVYIQRNITPPLEPNYWYYCRSAAGYYPYVRECPGGWEKVAPQPSVR